MEKTYVVKDAYTLDHMTYDEIANSVFEFPCGLRYEVWIAQGRIAKLGEFRSSKANGFYHDSVYYLDKADVFKGFGDTEIFVRYGITDINNFCHIPEDRDSQKDYHIDFPVHDSLEALVLTVRNLFIRGESIRYDEFDWNSFEGYKISVPVLKLLCKEQIRQGNPFNPVVFINDMCTARKHGGFDLDSNSKISQSIFEMLMAYPLMDEKTLEAFVKNPDMSIEEVRSSMVEFIQEKEKRSVPEYSAREYFGELREYWDEDEDDDHKCYDDLHDEDCDDEGSDDEGSDTDEDGAEVDYADSYYKKLVEILDRFGRSRKSSEGKDILVR